MRRVQRRLPRGSQARSRTTVRQPRPRGVSAWGQSHPQSVANGKICFEWRQPPARAEVADRSAKEIFPFGRTGGGGNLAAKAAWGAKAPFCKPFGTPQRAKPMTWRTPSASSAAHRAGIGFGNERFAKFPIQAMQAAMRADMQSQT